MGTKLDRKTLPPGHSPEDFRYAGRPAKDQGDFGSDVGIADGACVNQFGEANNSKGYHGGVVQSTKDNSWWCYFEWGRIKPGRSWEGGFQGQDFQFVQCSGESDARAFFSKQMISKNISRLEQKVIAGQTLWVDKVDKKGKPKGGYIIQSLATRETGLPDAYNIKDDAGLTVTQKKGNGKKSSKPKARPSSSYHPEEVALAKSLVGGTVEYARAAQAASGSAAPTMEAIQNVRDNLLPAALRRIKEVQDNLDPKSTEEQQLEAQVNDPDLQAISKMVASLVPTVIPRSTSQEERARMVLLSTDNILSRQQDLDAFESALLNEDFERETSPNAVDVDRTLNAQIRWIDPKSDLGRWLESSFRGMSNNRHGYLRGRKLVVKNMFTVTRPDRDAKFVENVRKVAVKRKGKFDLYARLQPRTRPDVSDISDVYTQANVFFGQHGTRSVNVSPILATNFRLPKTLKGVHITGAMFGGGCYYSSDFRKAVGYTSYNGSYWASGSGGIAGRGFFMFLCDILMGKAFPATRTGSWDTPPDGCDSIAAYNTFMSSLQNDEHIIFNPEYQRIRYLMELDFQ